MLLRTEARAYRKSIWFGDIDGPKPYRCIGFDGHLFHKHRWHEVGVQVSLVLVSLIFAVTGGTVVQADLGWVPEGSPA